MAAQLLAGRKFTMRGPLAVEHARRTKIAECNRNSGRVSPSLARAPSWHHIVVIAFENHGYAQILSRNAPASYFKTLAGKCGSAADFTAAHFPRSLGNYLAATGGRVVTTTDCTPSPACSSGGSCRSS